MRTRSLFMVLAAALLLLATGGPTSIAQNPMPPGRIPSPPPQGRSLFNMFWQIPERPAVQQRQPRERVAPAPRQAPTRVVVRDDPVIPKVDVNHHVLVIGDTLAGQIAEGLQDSLGDRADVAVVNKTKADSGLVRTDFYDWPKAAGEFLAADAKVMVGVISLGPNDRQVIREGDVTHEPLSERWLQLYKTRIDAIASAFSAKRVPLIWVGAPPMQNPRLSADLITLNDLFRKGVEAGGGQYVDLWAAYVDGENRYTATGPDVNGQIAKLRLGDGVHFTRAGARKAAHFVDVVVRRLLEGTPTQNVIALPTSPETGAPLAPDLQPGGVERLIDRMVSGLPADLQLIPVAPPRPLAGPILPLTGAVAGSGDTVLITSVQEARGRGDVAAQLDRVFGQGIAPEPRPGRADDFSWPRSN
ncbi:SGNH family hydrolase [Bosea vestrisii]|uniref:SGNH/GDSL hydrolase family protein n=1 Tax=Bosea vestrisii TaxID=151416 RepID=UPI0024DFA7A6|nr:SGNH family hydrolase [Bosea vestrisii]WID94218.1 SGNH family hydrolase [Bosea vestrisii]